MLVIDIKTIYAYARLDFHQTSSEAFLGSNIIDYVYTCLADLGFDSVNGRYVVVPEPIKTLLLQHIEKKMIGVPTTTIITLNKIGDFVYVNNR